MNKELLRPCRAHILLPMMLTAAIAGCASAPQQPAKAPQPEPVAQPVAAPQAAAPEPVVLQPDYPQEYVVKKGDTLWDIATRFLRDPWRWPELWQSNPQVKNPHLIYPGDILTLVYIEGKPTLQVQRGIEGEPAPKGRPAPAPELGGVRLSPKIRVEELRQAVPTIPLDAIGPFLTRPRVVTEDELEAAPYIVSSAGEHLIAGAGNRVYVRGISEYNTTRYAVVRRGQVYRSPDDPNDILGYEAIPLADAQIERHGDPATLLLTRSNREVLNGDRLLPAEAKPYQANFMPRAPENKVSGRIIAVPGGLTQIGQFQVVVLNLGQQEKLRPGDVLAVYQTGDVIPDRVGGGTVKLPNERAGTLMVFRTFKRVSYALVMEATRAMHLLDTVQNP